MHHASYYPGAKPLTLKIIWEAESGRLLEKSLSHHDSDPDVALDLAETALAQKMKWLSATDRSAAREAAREYLQRYPMGFGRADAERRIAGPGCAGSSTPTTPPTL